MTITIKTNPLWTSSLLHPLLHPPSLMISWRRCSIAHPLKPTPLDVASSHGPKLIAALKSPSKSTLALSQETLELRGNQVFTSQKLPLEGTRHTWSLLLVLLSRSASGTPTRSSEGAPRGGRDTGVSISVKPSIQEKIYLTLSKNFIYGVPDPVDCNLKSICKSTVFYRTPAPIIVYYFPYITCLLYLLFLIKHVRTSG